MARCALPRRVPTASGTRGDGFYKIRQLPGGHAESRPVSTDQCYSTSCCDITISIASCFGILRSWQVEIATWKADAMRAAAETADGASHAASLGASPNLNSARACPEFPPYPFFHHRSHPPYSAYATSQVALCCAVELPSS